MEYQRSDRVGDLLLEVICGTVAQGDPRSACSRCRLDRRASEQGFAPRAGLLSICSAAQDGTSEVLAGLKSATGFIRAKVGKQLNLRFVPDDRVYLRRHRGRSAAHRRIVEAGQKLGHAFELPTEVGIRIPVSVFAANFLSCAVSEVMSYYDAKRCASHRQTGRAVFGPGGAPGQENSWRQESRSSGHARSVRFGFAVDRRQRRHQDRRYFSRRREELSRRDGVGGGNRHPGRHRQSDR